MYSQQQKVFSINWSYINFYLLAMYLWKNHLCWVYQDWDILISFMWPLGMSLFPNYLGCHLAELPKNGLRVSFPTSNLVRRSIVVSSQDIFCNNSKYCYLYHLWMLISPILYPIRVQLIRAEMFLINFVSWHPFMDSRFFTFLKF